ncbi:hypothetical protein ABB37_06073 [Leptomonas pyrrhocoris]|uniref:Transmembrane protein n=1 Tax=Leptomonas pyrrhocoris TaxID=157538 RepID=A0A0M9FYF8_LEPPY|nr:hypothetical protein ABB37_06073 [Leptomonas pyrrhocoris]KPA78446.1 hypothetical protein ABB37_06073 [Leptomonas pyrrhocoris]|eukprot:XP_015656885.1 hypothetical protein ABB37_06073 [Leptomonas pyrrhocoris]
MLSDIVGRGVPMTRARDSCVENVSFFCFFLLNSRRHRVDLYCYALLCFSSLFFATVLLSVFSFSKKEKVELQRRHTFTLTDSNSFVHIYMYLNVLSHAY